MRILSNNPRDEVENSTMFTEPEKNNCFTIIAQVIIRAIAFPFILFVSFSKTSRNPAVSILKISASCSIIIASRAYDMINKI